MPRGDRTGPDGMGPMTGRAAGYCAGYNVPGYANPMYGRGFNRGGFGRGRGYRSWFHATGLPGWHRSRMGMPAYGNPNAYGVPPVYPQESLNSEDEKKILMEQAEYLKKDLEMLQKRINDLEKEKE
ncbi:DUF5320 domain-containing protein [bacterium]|nr:DUF5320 domain-containing protein [bacterium]